MSDLHDRAAALVAQATDRTQQKRLGRRLDAAPDLRRAVIALARAAGVDLPDEASEWAGKRLLRLAQGHSVEARARQNPIHRDEAFACAHCGAEVRPGGARVRDHCPACLRSLHVDVIPGDRAADCGGLLDPTGLEILGGEAILRYRCRRCGHPHRCRAHPDDDPRALAALSARAAP